MRRKTTAVRQTGNKSGRSHLVPKDNGLKADATRETFSKSHELGHALISGDGIDHATDRACFAALGRVALDFRATITAEVPFVKARQSAATSGRLMALILIRNATSGQQRVTVQDIVDQLRVKHPTVTGWVNWLRPKLVKREGNRYHAMNWDFSLLRKALPNIKIGLIQALATVEALEKEIDREVRNHPPDRQQEAR